MRFVSPCLSSCLSVRIAVVAHAYNDAIKKKGSMFTAAIACREHARLPYLEGSH